MDGEGIPTQALFKKWQFLAAYIVVRAVQARTTPLETNSKVAEIAKSHMTKRPFQVCSLSIIIHDMHFYIMHWDHRGAMASPQYSIQNELSLFIRIVLRLAQGMPAQKLGIDPSVVIERAPTDDIDESRFQVPVRDRTGRNSVEWRTEKHIFTSNTLIGQATSLWCVRTWDGSTTRVLKSRWRSHARLSESTCYKRIEGVLKGSPWPIGLCRYDTGHYIIFSEPDDPFCWLTTTYLRFGTKYGGSDFLMLRRILLKDKGCPLHLYNSPVQLLEGFKDAIKGR